MPGYKLIGQNYTTPDLVAKVTGRAKYAEDFRADGMLFCKLLLSPMPHCRVRGIDAREALAMPGVKAILTADDLPKPAAPAGGGARPSLAPEAALTNEPVYRGEPILAIAAIDELTAAEAIEKITLDLEPLPFVVDPLESLRPESPNARREGNAFVGGKLATHKWTANDFGSAPDGAMPMGEPGDQLGVRRSRRRLQAGRPRPRRDLSHAGDEPPAARDADRDGVLAERQAVPALLDAERGADGGVGGEVGRRSTRSRSWSISEYTGGGFGSKIPGRTRWRAGAAREEDRHAGDDAHQPRGGALHRPRAAVAAGACEGRLPQGRPPHGESTCSSLQDDGPVRGTVRPRTRRRHVLAGVSADRAALPRLVGAHQHAAADLAAGAGRDAAERHHGADAREGGAQLGDRCRWRCTGSTRPRARRCSGRQTRKGSAATSTSAFVREALDRGVELFDWDERKARSGKRRGSKARGIGIAGQPLHRRLLDRLRRPDDHPARRQAVRAVGHRQPRHPLGDRYGARRRRGARHAVGPRRGGLGRHQQAPAVDVHVRRQPDRRTPWRARIMPAAMDAKRKLQEIAAQDLGGRPEDYDVGGARVFRSGDRVAAILRSSRRRSARSSSAASSTATSCRPTSTRSRVPRRRRSPAWA